MRRNEMRSPRVAVRITAGMLAATLLLTVVTPVAAVVVPPGVCQITYAGGPYSGPGGIVESFSQAACGTSTVMVEMTVRIYRVSGTQALVATGYKRVQGLRINEIFSVLAVGTCTPGTNRYESRSTLRYDIGFRVITTVSKTVGPVTVTC
jgi:hypothetical protein